MIGIEYIIGQVHCWTGPLSAGPLKQVQFSQVHWTIPPPKKKNRYIIHRCTIGQVHHWKTLWWCTLAVRKLGVGDGCLSRHTNSWTGHLPPNNFDQAYFFFEQQNMIDWDKRKGQVQRWVEQKVHHTLCHDNPVKTSFGVH